MCCRPSTETGSGPTQQIWDVVAHRAEIAQPPVGQLCAEFYRALGVPVLDLQPARLEQGFHVRWMAHVAGDRAAHDLAQHDGEFGPRHRLGAEIIVLRGVVLGSVAQDLGRDRRNICNGDVADPLLSPEHRERTARRRRHVQHSIHEHVGVQMRPGYATGLDVALDQREPGEFRVGAVVVGKDALIDDVLHPRLLGGVDQRLGLVRHGDRVAGQDIEPIDTAERGPECARIVEVEQHRVATFIAQPLQILLLAHPDTDACVARVSVEILQNEVAGLAGDAHKEDEWAVVGRHDCSPVVCVDVEREEAWRGSMIV